MTKSLTYFIFQEATRSLEDWSTVEAKATPNYWAQRLSPVAFSDVLEVHLAMLAAALATPTLPIAVLLGVMLHVAEDLAFVGQGWARAAKPVTLLPLRRLFDRACERLQQTTETTALGGHAPTLELCRLLQTFFPPVTP